MSGQKRTRTLTAAERKELATMKAQFRNENRRRQVSDAEAHLMRFVMGQEHQPDAPLQLDDIVQTIDMLMDDDLIDSLEAVLQVYMFGRDPHQSILEFTAQANTAHKFLQKLRELQKTRLRDAIGKLNRRSVN